MKRLFAGAAALCAALALSGCAGFSIGPAPGSGAPSAGTVVLSAEKALYAAEAAFDGASLAAEAAANSGALKGSAAIKVRDALDRAHDSLLVARAAWRVGDLAAVSLHTTEASNAIASVQAAAKPQ